LSPVDRISILTVLLFYPFFVFIDKDGLFQYFESLKFWKSFWAARREEGDIHPSLHVSDLLDQASHPPVMGD
jgi:hypothetical protein